jgi:HSP20 family protein
MAIAYRDPFEQLQVELDRMLESAFGPVRTATAGVYPPVNAFDAGEDFVVKAELPGVEPEKIEIEVEDDTLVLRGERTLAEATPEAAYHRRERGEGRFRRVVRLPGRVDSSGAKAEYREGVLTVRVPKAKETRPRKVTVQAA